MRKTTDEQRATAGRLAVAMNEDSVYIGDTAKSTYALLSDYDRAVVIRALQELQHSNLNDAPIPMLLTCPACGARHVDVGEFATKPHHTHACQVCGMCWRPAVVPTVGVHFLPGFKDETT